VNVPRPRHPRISIVIPARNEARNLRLVLPELPAVHEVILVDGHSVDGTVETALEIMPSIKVVHQTRKGKGNALACGFAAVTGDLVVMFDADGSANPAEIPAFVAALTGGADFAKGSRYAKGGGSEDITPIRSLGNHALSALANAVLRTKYTDLCYGYNAFWADVLVDLDLPDHRVTPIDPSVMLWGDGFEIETVINCRIAFAQLRTAEIPSVERRRIFGESNLNAVRDGIRVLKTIWAERRRALQIRATVASAQNDQLGEFFTNGVSRPVVVPAQRTDSKHAQVGADGSHGLVPGQRLEPSDPVLDDVSVESA
jgi:glycosyltransferase involved in cell wall biosynthesis